MPDESDAAADDLIQPGMYVMVRSGEISGEINGHLPLVAWARVIQRADDPNTWWLNVWMGLNEPLPQMYRTEEILGTPALGVHYKPVVRVR